jgi:hypothetical protein
MGQEAVETTLVAARAARLPPTQPLLTFEAGLPTSVVSTTRGGVDTTLVVARRLVLTFEAERAG